MGLCWWCYWGWPKPISDVYEKALKELGGNTDPLHFGPAHVVWEDENFDDAQWCLDQFEWWTSKWNDGRYSDGELDVVRQSLIDLLAVPEEFKMTPAGYNDDDENDPELFPPPDGWVMVRK